MKKLALVSTLVATLALGALVPSYATTTAPVVAKTQKAVEIAGYYDYYGNYHVRCFNRYYLINGYWYYKTFCG